MYTQLGLYIDGKWNHGNGGGGEEVINPATAEAARAPAPRHDQATSMRRSPPRKGRFQVWKAKSAYDRGRIIKKAADLVRERADQIARVMTQEQGKVLAEAKGEVDDHRRHRRMVRRGRPPRLWPHHPEPQPDRAPDGGDRAGRRRGGVHAVEFPDAHAGAQDRGRARRRLLDHRQGVGRNARRLRRAA